MENGNEQGIKKLVDAILESYGAEADIVKIGARNQVDHDVVVSIIDDLKYLIYGGFFGKKALKCDSVEYVVGETVERLSRHLERQIARALRHKKGIADKDTSKEAEEITYEFLSKIPEIRSVLRMDVDAFYDGDPAAFSKDEIIFSYPGLFAVTVYRLAHELYVRRVPLIPRMMTEYAHGKTGIDIHPGATIGHHFFLDHGTGIVVGETSEIGNFVKIYQGVTLGALSTRGGQILSGGKRHPTIEDHVTIYSGASILGGTTIIGEGVVIGSNAFITKSVSERTKVSIKNPELQYKVDDRTETAELKQDVFWDYII